jgi:hypothetical protein
LQVVNTAQVLDFFRSFWVHTPFCIERILVGAEFSSSCEIIVLALELVEFFLKILYQHLVVDFLVKDLVGGKVEPFLVAFSLWQV